GIGGAGDDALGSEGHGLLRRAALAVDRRRRDVPRKAAGDPRVAAHVAALLPRLGHAAADDVVDRPRVDVVALEQRAQGEPEEIGRVPAGQRALPLADRGTHGVDDDGLTYVHGAPSLEPAEPDMVVRSSSRAVISREEEGDASDRR